MRSARLNCVVLYRGLYAAPHTSHHARAHGMLRARACENLRVKGQPRPFAEGPKRPRSDSSGDAAAAPTSAAHVERAVHLWLGVGPARRAAGDRETVRLWYVSGVGVGR